MKWNEPWVAYLTATCIVCLTLYFVKRRSEFEPEAFRILTDEAINREILLDTALSDVGSNNMETRIRSLTLDGQANLVVGVCGGTGSGKTTLARAIMENFGVERVTYLSHDYYYKDLGKLTDEQARMHNFDHPDALETELLLEHLTQLRNGDTVAIPKYDFATHRRLEETTMTVPRRVILVEGILIFTDARLVDLMDIKIFVDTPDDIRFIRRLKRDMQERNRTADSVMHQYMKTVRPMHQSFVEPSKRCADILVPHGINAVALEMILSRLNSFTQQDSREFTC